MLYLTLVVVLQYAHVFKKTTSLFGELSDHLVRLIIRILVALIAGLICFGRIVYDCPPRLLSHYTRVDTGACFHTYTIVLVLTTICLATNFVLRLLIHYETRRGRRYSIAIRTTVRQIFCTMFIMAFGLVISVAAYRRMDSLEDGHQLWSVSERSRAKRASISVLFCVLLPSAVTVAVKDIRRYVCRKICTAILQFSDTVIGFWRLFKMGLARIYASATVAPYDYNDDAVTLNSHDMS